MFLAAGADAANALNGIDNQCDFIYNTVQNICHETQALAAFAFLAWIAREYCQWTSRCTVTDNALDV